MSRGAGHIGLEASKNGVGNGCVGLNGPLLRKGPRAYKMQTKERGFLWGGIEGEVWGANGAWVGLLPHFHNWRHVAVKLSSG